MVVSSPRFRSSSNLLSLAGIASATLSGKLLGGAEDKGQGCSSELLPGPSFAYLEQGHLTSY